MIITAMTVQDWHSARCWWPVFYSCYLVKIHTLGWSGSLLTMSVVAVVNNWCSWTCATADGLCHAVWGMSVPAVPWSLKWDHLMSLSYSSTSPQSPCLQGANYIFCSKWLAIRQPGLTYGKVDPFLWKNSICRISSSRQNQEYALHSSLQDYITFTITFFRVLKRQNCCILKGEHSWPIIMDLLLLLISCLW